ncbi:MAG: cysteine hydrolase family protein [Gallionella sp.]
MDISKTAVILIGFQKDYFESDGILHGVIEASVDRVLTNTLGLLTRLLSTSVTLVATPIIFTPDYSELVDPVGILKTIRDVGAFKEGSLGAQTLDQLAEFGERITIVNGKRGLNAFHETELASLLNRLGITTVVLAGMVTSICIDSTARSAFELGFKVCVLSDCTGGRTDYEQEFYCKEIFPLYSQVKTSGELLALLKIN